MSRLNVAGKIREREKEREKRNTKEGKNTTQYWLR